MIPKYNTLGKVCVACVFANLTIAYFMATNGYTIAILNVISAFLCHLGSFSNKCRK